MCQKRILSQKSLRDYSGIYVTDGHQASHTLEKEKGDPTIVVCWMHGHRKLKKVCATILTEGKKKSVTYPLNQEKYLQVFPNDGDIPMDNNISECTICGFCIEKKNWEGFDRYKASAVIGSVAEAAKANNLKSYEYFEHLLNMIPGHKEDTDHNFGGRAAHLGTSFAGKHMKIKFTANSEIGLRLSRYLLWSVYSRTIIRG